MQAAGWKGFGGQQERVEARNSTPARFKQSVLKHTHLISHCNWRLTWLGRKAEPPVKSKQDVF